MKDWQVKFTPKTGTKRERQEEIINFLLTSRAIKQEKVFFSPPDPAKILPQDAGIVQAKINRAYQAILSTQAKNKKVLIWGDYDADGIIGTSLLWQALWQSGIEAIPFIPDRAEGYGLSFASFKKLYRQYPDIGLVITVDNGIVAHEVVEKITALGVAVIITDHHTKEKTLPEAKTILWSDQVCGAAVAWFLAREITGQRDYALDLVALATVADMMPLLGINRSLVKFGLGVLTETDCLGLKALMDQAGIKDQELSVYHLGFLLSPRLNAMGRLYDAMDSVRLLCTTNRDRAKRLAQKLDSANRERQVLTDQALEKAALAITKNKQEKEKIIFAKDSSFHPGIIGLVAGRLTERFSRPSVVLSTEDGFCRASCRSIKGFNIIKALKTIDELVEVGGHPLAAGFTVKKADWPQVRKKLTSLANEEINTRLFQPSLTIDAAVSFADLDYRFWEKINRFSPFGLGNPEPLFYTPGVIVKNLVRVGRNGDHLKLVLDDSQTRKIEKTPARFDTSRLFLPGIGFGLGQEDLAIGDRIDLAFNLIVNRYQGRENLELKLKEVKKT
ncbi:MAG: DHHA1 domain-containing protein [Candidatus Shapirobacteria bacterium]|nr:DHHA1 domain-containing protein [Candidatus Shapirobacteria bacterium]MDD5073989.1 DHHA1 domain-containing protein [Candidatus Shapirobacteria bacterium]